MKRMINYLDENQIKFGSKRAYFNDEVSFTWSEIRDLSFRVATGLIKKFGQKKEGEIIEIKLKKTPYAIISFLGITLSGRPYVFIDEALPKERLDKINEIIQPLFTIDNESLTLLLETEIEEDLFRDEAENIDPEESIYVSFTSSTTGDPKGVLTSFASVSNYVNGLVECLGFHSESIMANQAPFYFDAYLKDVYTALFTGGSTYLVRKDLFINPLELVKKLDEYGVNTLTWTASAYTILENYDMEFQEAFLDRMELITFGSEVMNPRVLNFLREKFQKARIFQLYGATETTGMTSYYEVLRDFEQDERIPIGTAFPGTDVFLYEGEIVVTGKGLAKGYYNNPQKTEEAFRDVDGKRAYFTGDLGKLNEEELIVFLGRKNRVIKRAGYMLSLDSLESIVKSFDKVKSASAIFVEEKDKIILFYEGNVDAAVIRDQLRFMLPKSVVPSKIQKLDKIPRLANGKIDYRGLKNAENNTNFEGCK